MNERLMEKELDFLYKLPVYNVNWEDLSQRGGLENILDPFDAKQWACVDGRVVRRALRYPGGHAGLFMTFLHATTIAHSKKESDVYNTLSFFLEITGSDKLLYHSDEHANDASFKCAGCGHLNLMRQNPELYGVNPTWLSELFNAKTNDLRREMEEDDAEILRGEHDETFALYIVGKQKTILPMRDSGNSFFVIHNDIATELLSKLLQEYMDLEMGAAHEISQRAVSAHSTPTFKALVHDKGLKVKTFEV